MNNINSKNYWDARFSSGDWESRRGRFQTQQFAKEQIGFLNLPCDFNGTLLDFGCGLGDAIPFYKKKFPRAKLIGMDISSIGIEKCKKRYGSIAEFLVGSYLDVPKVDVIISSNVFEHLSNDLETANILAQRCKNLYIIVPYREQIKETSNREHINSYNEESFANLSCVKYNIYESRGLYMMTWLEMVFNIWVKNVFRFILRRPMVKPAKQIIFHFKGSL